MTFYPARQNHLLTDTRIDVLVLTALRYKNGEDAKQALEKMNGFELFGRNVSHKRVMVPCVLVVN